MTGWGNRPQGVQGQLKVAGGHAGELEQAQDAARSVRLDVLRDLRGVK
ncbi:hypothetical protein [Streptomyces sp. NPDC017448]